MKQEAVVYLNQPYKAVITRTCDEPCWESPPCRIFFEVADKSSSIERLNNIILFLTIFKKECDGLTIDIQLQEDEGDAAEDILRNAG